MGKCEWDEVRIYVLYCMIYNWLCLAFRSMTSRTSLDKGKTGFRLSGYEKGR